MQNIGRHPQVERGGVEWLFRVPFKDDLKVNAVRWKVFEVLFELGDFLVELFTQQLVTVQVFGDEIPGEWGQCSHRQFKWRLVACASS